MPKRKTWIKIHRSVGLFSCLWLFIIALTGLTLSFSQSLGLEKKYFTFKQHNSLIENFKVRVQHGHVYINEQQDGVLCKSPITAMVEYDAGLLVACQNILYWLSGEGDIIDKQVLEDKYKPISAAYFSQELLFLAGEQGLLKWNPQDAQLNTTSELESQDVGELPALPIVELHAKSFWEWLLKIHTGLIAGDIGRWLFRLAGLGLLLLCISGFKNALRL